jgi:hypothetical protein
MHTRLSACAKLMTVTDLVFQEDQREAPKRNLQQRLFKKHVDIQFMYYHVHAREQV